MPVARLGRLLDACRVRDCASGIGGSAIRWLRTSPLSVSYRWVFIDAAGTLLEPAEDVADVYHRLAIKHGLQCSKAEVLARYRVAYQRPWADTIRFRGDARDFWRAVVTDTLGKDHERCFDDIYQYYAEPESWRVRPGARTALLRLREAGFGLCCVSNFDSRLRDILYGLGVGTIFHHVVVSADVGFEKPHPGIFEAALERCGAAPAEVLHVGDDRRNDVWGARDAGIHAWQFGNDVTSFQELADLLIARKQP